MKVNIYRNSGGCRDMAHQEGWTITAIEDCDFVIFPGGQDIDPSLYGQQRHFRTYANLKTDEMEIEYMRKARNLGKPLVGICRGGQLLNVLAGGSMYQDVNNHGGLVDHTVVDIETGKTFTVNSLHHQMMRPSDSAEILSVASEATRIEYFNGDRLIVTHPGRGEDIEAVWYDELDGLCVQWHPEMASRKTESRTYFVELVKRYIQCAD